MTGEGPPSGSGLDVEVIQADVTRLDVDAITNAANTQLRHGGVAAVRDHQPRSLRRVVFAVHGDAAERAFSAALTR